jgi:peptide/nickel transport system substrate-binding protein
VDLKIFEIGDLNKDVIRPRKYDALFFGQILGRTPDLFSFWASSQRLDPGYNIALYANLGVDRLLDELRGAKPDTDTSALYRRLSETISADTPAIFLYSPDFLYLAPSKIKNLTLPPITTPSDRFATLPAWHIGTDKVWKIFTKQSVN